MRSDILVVFFGLHAFIGAFRPPQCLNSDGKEVDWWFIIKENSGMRYVYYDSKMATASSLKKHSFRPMSLKYLLDDPVSSPLVRTIYRDYKKDSVETGKVDKKKEAKNRKNKDADQKEWFDASETVFVAVNDQPEPVERGKNKDAFKKPVSANSGHVKLFTSARVKHGEKDTQNDSTLYSYLIQHSMPRFPVMESETEGGYLDTLPKNAARIFPSSGKSSGQHFMCMSFQDKVVLDKRPKLEEEEEESEENSDENPRPGSYQLRYRRRELEKYLTEPGNHFIKILHYLKTVHAAIVGTNYNPFKVEMSAFHQYLNVYNNWSPIVTKSQRRECNTNMARTGYKDLGNIDSSHVCPIWPINRIAKIDKNREMECSRLNQGDETEVASMRGSGDGGYGVCRSWKGLGTDDPLCLASAILETTNRQVSVKGILMMKSRNVALNVYDDLAAPLTVHKVDYESVKENPEHYETEMSLGFIVQSWIDKATLPKVIKNLLPEKSPLKVELTIENSSGLHLPMGNGRSKEMRSQGVDHSKWALLVPRGTVGSFPGLFCISDLNRSYLQEQRGGGIMCFSDPVFTELMLSLKPDAEKEASSKGIPYHKLKDLYTNFDQVTMTAVKMMMDNKSPVFYLATQRTDQDMVVSRMPYPYSSMMTREVALPSVARGMEEPKDDVELKLHGDIELKKPESVELTDIDMYRSPFSDFSRFFTGKAMNIAMKIPSVDGILRLPITVWSRMQQQHQLNAYLSILYDMDIFTSDWLTKWLPTKVLGYDKKRERTGDKDEAGKKGDKDKIANKNKIGDKYEGKRKASSKV